MSFITFSLKATSDDAQKEDLSIGVSVSDKGVDLLLNSQNKTTKISASDSLRINFSLHCNKPAPKNNKPTNIVKYNEKTNSFEGKYRHKSDLNIIEFDRVLSIVLADNDNAKILCKKIEEFKARLKSPLSMIERRFYIQELDRLEQKVKKSQDAIQEYKNDVEHILDEYRNKKSMMSRTNLAERYINITTKYVNYDLYLQHNDHFICVGCRESLSDQIIESNANIVCVKCQCINVSRNKVKVENEKSTHSSAKKGKNEDTFLKSFTRLLCKQRVDIPNELKTKLDDYFTQREDMKPGSQIKKMPSIRDGTKLIKKGTSLELMIDALEECGYNTMYSDVRYLCVWYWGWKVEDYSHLKEDIIYRYRITGGIYSKIKEGSSNLKADFHLCKILRTMGIDCKLNDFKPVKGIKTLGGYESYWLEIIKEIKNDDKYNHYNGKEIIWKFED